MAYYETRTGLGLGPGLGKIENPDSTKTRTRHTDLPLEKTGLAFTKPGLDMYLRLHSKLDSLKTARQSAKS